MGHELDTCVAKFTPRQDPPRQDRLASPRRRPVEHRRNAPALERMANLCSIGRRLVSGDNQLTAVITVGIAELSPEEPRLDAAGPGLVRGRPRPKRLATGPTPAHQPVALIAVKVELLGNNRRAVPAHIAIGARIGSATLQVLEDLRRLSSVQGWFATTRAGAVDLADDRSG